MFDFKVSHFSKLVVLASLCFLLFIGIGIFLEGEDNASPKTEITDKIDKVEDQRTGSKVKGEELITSIISDSLMMDQEVSKAFFSDEWAVIYPMDGDTIYSLSRREDMPLTALVEVNDFSLNTRLSSDDPVIKFMGDKLESKAPLEEIAEARKMPLRILQMYNGNSKNRNVVILPKTRESPSLLRFHFLSPFSKRLFRSPGGSTIKILPSGYLTMKNRSVKAVADGLVIFRGFADYYGQTVILKHPLNYFTVYANLSSSNLKRRTLLRQGQEVGKVEGLLYFQLRQGIVPMDARVVF